jgi:hypothetical protein
MNRTRFMLNALAAFTIFFACSMLAQAQATRTWVSGVGDDVNPCSRTAPCKTFAGAISKTAAGGEIDAMDPGGYGTLTITKAITIDGSGTFASVLNSGTNGFNINAGPNDIVTLRGLSIQGARQSTSPGVTGIKFNSGKGLNVLDCVILNENSNGIDVTLGAAGSFVFVRNTVVKNCAGDALSATTTVGTVKVMVKDSSFVECGNGLHAKSNSNVSADSSVFSNNSICGVLADGSTGVAVANITNSSIDNNAGAGVQAQGAGNIARINDSDIMQNVGNGVFVGPGGLVNTYGNNRFSGNADGSVCTSCTALSAH